MHLKQSYGRSLWLISHVFDAFTLLGFRLAFSSSARSMYSLTWKSEESLFSFFPFRGRKVWMKIINGHLFPQCYFSFRIDLGWKALTGILINKNSDLSPSKHWFAFHWQAENKDWYLPWTWGTRYNSASQYNLILSVVSFFMSFSTASVANFVCEGGNLEFLSGSFLASF